MDNSTTISSVPFFRRMYSSFNWIFTLVFARRIRTVHLSEKQKESIASHGHKIVYVLKQASVLEFNFFNALLTNEGLPIAGLAPQVGIWFLFWLPWKDAFSGLWQWIKSWGKTYGPRWKTHFETDLDHFLDNDSPLLLCLTPEYRFSLLGAGREGAAYLDSLLAVAQRRHRALAFVPLHYIYDYRPEKPPSKWISFLTDYRFQQGLLLRFLYFFSGSRRMGKLELGDLIVYESTNPYLIEQTLSQAFQEERLRLAGPDLATPREMYREFLLDPRFYEGLSPIAARDGVAQEQLLKQVARYFFEIAADMHPSYIDFYDLVLRRVFKGLYKGLSIDEDGLEKIKTLSGKGACVVFVPNHRSHADYLLLSYILYEHHMTPPHVCAGINLKFWPLSYFFRRGGAFFIHRNLDERSLYGFVLKSYLGALIGRGYSLEFFMEGTRSRTGKLLRPKLGFLHFVLETFLRETGKELYIVPVSITYDKVLEDKSYAEEKAGKTKKKESWIDLVRLKQFLRGNYGQVHIRFSAPLSARTILADEGLANHTLAREHVAAVAARICHGINQSLVVTASSLVAMVFLHTDTPSLTKDQVFGAIVPYLDYLRYRNRPLTPGLQTNPAQAVKEALKLFVRARTLQGVVDGGHFFYTLAPEKRLALDYYRNNAIHFFVSLACISILLCKTPGKTIFISTLAHTFDRLKALLGLEFTFSLRLSTTKHSEEILAYCRQKGWVEVLDTQRVRLTPQAPAELGRFADLLTPFLEAYWLVASGIESFSFYHMPRKSLVKKIIDLGEIKRLRGLLRLPESLNPWTLANALDYFRNKGFVVSHEQEEGKAGREFFSKVTARTAELGDEKAWVERLLGR